MNPRPETMTEKDVIDLLMHQHEEVKAAFADVEAAVNRDGKLKAFERLVRLLAVHETAEEEVVHPRLRHLVPDGGRIVEQRLDEERQAKLDLADLEADGVDAPDFDIRLASLKSSVTAHAQAEEEQEFPLIRKYAADKTRSMARAVKAAEALAPTHPHPNTESMAANMVIGPFAAVADRVRDTLRHVTHH